MKLYLMHEDGDRIEPDDEVYISRQWIKTIDGGTMKVGYLPYRRLARPQDIINAFYSIAPSKETNATLRKISL